MNYGYHRTSTKEQHFDRGLHEIKRYCEEELQLLACFLPMSDFSSHNLRNFRYGFYAVFVFIQPFWKVGFIHNGNNCAVLFSHFCSVIR